MSKYTFEQLKEVVLKWSQSNVSEKLKGSNYAEITKNEDEILLIDLTFKYCLAQIVISKPIFAPYQYVSFQAMTLESKRAQEEGRPEIVYFFYDSEGMVEEEILDELNFGVSLCSKYIPDELTKVYLNHKGLLTIGNENLRHVIHPDDLKKYDKDFASNDFVCINIEAQYLKIENSFISLRVLPQVFTIKQK